jgi:predicted DNA-binding ribbon-helix-helix protein
VVKRSIVISGHKTSVSAEAEFWKALKDITASQGCDISGLVTDIGKTRQAGKRSFAIRLFVLDTFKSARSRQPPAEPSLSAPTEIAQVMLAIVQYERHPRAGAYDQAD